jgi:hypothetical protein
LDNTFVEPGAPCSARAAGVLLALMFLARLATLDGVRVAYDSRNVGEWVAYLFAGETIPAESRF